MYNPALSCYMQ